MKKIKFLSCAAMAAFFAMSLTSCEKEDFTTDVEAPEVNVPSINIPGITIPEGYKPGDAVISIQPTVIGMISATADYETTTETKDITNETKITYNGKEKFEYSLNADRGVNAMTVEIVAAYTLNINGFSQTFTAKRTIEIPKLDAGMVSIITPTLIINASGSVEFESPEYEYVPDNETGMKTLLNNTPYYYVDFVAKKEYYTGIDNFKKNIDESYKNHEMLNRWINNLESYVELYPEEAQVTIPFFAANSTISIPYVLGKDKVTVTYKAVADWSRAADETKVVATVTYDEYMSFTFDYSTDKWEFTESTNSHGAHGHGHGHAGNDNAGGGIVWGE